MIQESDLSQKKLILYNKDYDCLPLKKGLIFVTITNLQLKDYKVEAPR